jgi:hypothetical protein
MKTAYLAIMAQLKKQCPQLKWIDIDFGQIDKQTERLPVAFPCAVIVISVSGCEDQYGKVQVCRSQVSVRIAQNPPTSRTNSEATGDIRESAMSRYDLIDEVFCALQGFGEPQFNPLSRTRQSIERRTDGLFVCRMDFNTEFQDLTAEEEEE